MLGGDESEVSIADVRKECAIEHFSKARLSKARAFFGFESRV